MENNYYQIYEESVLQLAESLVIKSADTARAINDELYIQYGPTAVNQLDPTTWKYYLHLSGEYHLTDTVMQVISMDTLETINFTRENLQHHRGTAKAYIFGSKHYKELIARYPTQERLIRGILYPADLTTAIESQDGTILAYPAHLIESHEYSLINKLQAWLYSFLARWDNIQFRLSHNQYSTTTLGMMYLLLVQAIFVLRKEACKTNEAHSYHVRQYLASHGLLDVYLDFMSRQQALFLYRNIAYIERNSGKQAVFEWLTEHIMTRRGLPLAAYEMRHDLENQPANLKPLLSFEKIPLNTKYNFDLRNKFTLDEVLDKEDPLARDNVRYRTEEQNATVKKMEYSLSNRLNTKLLESSMTDFTGSERYTLADISLNHWIFLSSTNHYRAFVSVPNPATGEVLALSAKDAYAFFIYAFYRSVLGRELEMLPIVTADRVLRIPKPPLSDIMSVVDRSRVPDAFGQEMLDLMPTPQPMISVDAFYDYCVELQTAAMTQWYSICAEELMWARGYKHGLVSRIWSDVDIQIGEEGQTYDEWFSERNIQIADYTLPHLQTLTVSLLEAATGLDSANRITLADILRAMVRLMAQLSSYSVQYVSSINVGPIRDGGSSTLRVDDWKGTISGNEEVPTAVTVIDRRINTQMGIDYELGSPAFDQEIHISFEINRHFEIDVKPRFADNGMEFSHKVPLNVGISYIVPENLPPNPLNMVPVAGIETYLALSEEERLAIPDLWHE